ncbi:LysR family transcriptional regulator, partial [Ramlibacter sp.]|uniref:LysR family transcriptional regulator n=1 Tax=Ramlibacter sp. TaxID=1917967 RepID=UPI00179E5783
MNDIALPPVPRLDARDLRLVVALAHARTTAAGASLLHLTQPAVSRALQAVETRLGVRLFERTPRGLEPTGPGRVLLEGATALMAGMRDLEQRVVGPAQAAQEVRLVCECYTAYHWVPGVLQQLRGALPGITLRIAVEHTPDPYRALHAGEIDVAMGTGKPALERGFRSAPLFADEVVFVVSRASPLAHKPHLTRDDLVGQPLLTGHLPTPSMTWFNRAVASKGGAPLHYQEVPLTEAILDLARADMGIAVLSEWIAAPHLLRGDLVAKRLRSGPLLRPWRIFWRPQAAA